MLNRKLICLLKPAFVCTVYVNGGRDVDLIIIIEIALTIRNAGCMLEINI